MFVEIKPYVNPDENVTLANKNLFPFIQDHLKMYRVLESRQILFFYLTTLRHFGGIHTHTHTHAHLRPITRPIRAGPVPNHTPNQGRPFTQSSEIGEDQDVRIRK